MESALYQPVPSNLTLIETLRYEPAHGPVRGILHLQRMGRAARLFGLPFDMMQAAAHLDGVHASRPKRLRLTLTRDDGFALQQANVPEVASRWTVALASQSLRSTDPWRRVKTNQRQIYDDARATMPAHLDEVLFVNETGALVEGTITNIFLRRDERLLTPPLESGCLPGVLRQDLLERGRAQEAELFPDDLRTGELFVGNSLRNLIPARVVGDDSVA